MKSIYGSYIIYIVAFGFIILFTGYICVSINQTKAFNAKNEVLKAIERNYPFETATGVSVNFSNDVKEAFNELGYRITGKCDCTSGGIGYCFNPTGDIVKCISNCDEAAFCVHVDNESRAGLEGKIYTVETYYNIELFAFSKILPFNMTASGKSKWLYSAN